MKLEEESKIEIKRGKREVTRMVKEEERKRKKQISKKPNKKTKLPHPSEGCFALWTTWEISHNSR